MAQGKTPMADYPLSVIVSLYGEGKKRSRRQAQGRRPIPREVFWDQQRVTGDTGAALRRPAIKAEETEGQAACWRLICALRTWARQASPKAWNILIESGFFAACHSGCHCTANRKGEMLGA